MQSVHMHHVQFTQKLISIQLYSNAICTHASHTHTDIYKLPKYITASIISRRFVAEGLSKDDSVGLS